MQLTNMWHAAFSEILVKLLMINLFTNSTPTEVRALKDENLFMQITSIRLTGQHEHLELLSLDINNSNSVARLVLPFDRFPNSSTFNADDSSSTG